MVESRDRDPFITDQIVWTFKDDVEKLKMIERHASSKEPLKLEPFGGDWFVQRIEWSGNAFRFSAQVILKRFVTC